MLKRAHILAAAFLAVIHSGLSAAPGIAAEQSDSFFASGRIPVLLIDLEPSALVSLRQQPRTYVRARVQDANTVFTNVGIHLKGGVRTFRAIDDKPSLTLSFHKFSRGQRFEGLVKLHLNNSLQDPTFMMQSLAADLFRAAGIPAARASQAKVVLNGRDLGLFTLVEAMDKQFLGRHFSDSTGNLYEGHRQDVADPLAKISGTEPRTGRGALDALAAAANKESNTLAGLAEVLDLDRFYSFLAMENLTCHWDGYTLSQNNYRLYHEPSPGRLVFMPAGMDQMFGRPRSSLFPDCAGIVVRSVFSTPEGRAQYRKRCKELFFKVFSVPRLTNQIAEVESRIRPVLAEISPRALQQHDDAVRQLRSFIDERGRFLTQELNREPSRPVFDDAGKAPLMRWTAQVDSGDASLTKIEQPTPALVTRSVALHIPFVASWRTEVTLPPGRYRFLGKAQATEFIAMKDAPGGGINLRAYAHPTAMRPALPGTLLSLDLGAEFNLPTEQDVQLICEVWAYRGVVTFPTAALHLQRISGKP